MGSASIVTVATPAYLKKHGTPKIPSDLEHHECVVYVLQSAVRVWRFEGKYGSIVHHPKGKFHTNDAEQIRMAVLADFGLAYVPAWLFANELASGAVVKVLSEYEPPLLPIAAVHSGGRRLATKVRVVIDFLNEIFAEERDLAIH